MTEMNCTTQNPQRQTKKYGGNRKPMTQEQYLAKAIKKHDSKFDYSKTVYRHSKDKIKITCPTHGDFEQTAESHLRSKHGCQECAKEATVKNNTLTGKDFVEKARVKHKAKYDYSKVKYIDSTTEVEIICPEHGSFFRTPNSHIHGGYGCNKCAGIPVYDTKHFIERAKEVHADSNYDYSNTEYKGAHELVEIICKKHGSFYQTPNQHLKPYGCPKCGIKKASGWKRSDFISRCDRNNDGKGTLYVIHCQKDNESFYKIGVTAQDIRRRFRNSREMPYTWEVIFEVEGAGDFIYDIEYRLHSLVKGYRYNPKIQFRGYTECFSTIKPIESLLKELAETDQLQLIA
ncbi:GIY-YIG nuclease family protein [Psychrobacter raelei]|uniref:GIY-YIG nuclease family protein n=1 Tax=Psychrobacter raelei TaxID=2565531 RepID=A0AAT9PBJ7_9GAMM